MKLDRLMAAGFLAVCLCGAALLTLKHGRGERAVARLNVARANPDRRSTEARAASAERQAGDGVYKSDPLQAANDYRSVIAEHAASKDPEAQDEVATAHIRLAYLDSKKRDYEAARRELAAVTTDYKGTGLRADFGGLKDEAAYQSIACLMAEGKKAEAKTALMSFLKDYPLSPLVSGAQNRLRLLGGGDAGADANALVQRDLDRQDAEARFEAAVCGPKTLAELLKRLSRPPMDYEKIAKLCGTSEKGTTVEQMRDGMKKLGLNSFAFVVNRGDFVSLPVPSIWLDGQHYMLLLSVKADVATVFDPFLNSPRAVKLPPSDDPDFQASVITLQAPEFKESQS